MGVPNWFPIQEYFMNTPCHYIINLALLGNTIAPDNNVAITIGAILPDLPIFGFYCVVKFIDKLPEEKIWSEAYYQPFWQNLVALFHSIPLALIGLLVCLYGNWQSGTIICLSALMHSLCDLPVHHSDAHRHFFPFSNYRFISPISYWDSNHYGKIVAFFELLLVLAVNPLVLSLLHSFIAKGLTLAIALLYLFGFFHFYVRNV